MRRSSNRLALAALVCLCACGHHKGATEAPKSSDAGPPPLVKRVSIAFEGQANGANVRVFLVATEESGKSTSYPLGDFPGPYTSIAADGADLVTFECKGDASTGTVRLHAVKEGQDVAAYRERFGSGGSADPMNRDEIGR